MAISRRVFIASGFIILTILVFASIASAASLRQGMRGDEVRQVQIWLKNLGYLNEEPTGYFGKDTARAVRNFQTDNALKVDGIVGNETKRLLRDKAENRPSTYTVGENETIQDIATKLNVSDKDLATLNGIQPGDSLTTGQVLKIPSSPSANSSRTRHAVELVPWDEAKEIFPLRAIARVTDVETGLTFRVFRHGGHFHADSEPYSSDDTLVIWRIYGGHWSWRRRAIIVEVGGHRIAASMNGMPHGQSDIANNSFPGHFCIHFYGSRIHRSGRVDPDHQSKIMEALGRY
jgi:LysM repeat protein